MIFAIDYVRKSEYCNLIGEIKFRAQDQEIEQCNQTLLSPVGGASGHETRSQALRALPLQITFFVEFAAFFVSYTVYFVYVRRRQYIGSRRLSFGYIMTANVLRIKEA